MVAIVKLNNIQRDVIFSTLPTWNNNITMTNLGIDSFTKGQDGDEGKHQEGNLPTPHKGDDNSTKGGHKLYDMCRWCVRICTCAGGV